MIRMIEVVGIIISSCLVSITYKNGFF